MAIDSWSKVRIYATWTNHLGALLPGTYLIRVPARLTNSADDIIIPAGIWAEGSLSTTSGSPSLSIPCPSTDDPDIQQDDWKLEVEINFTNGQRGEKYVLDVPIANRPVVDGGDGLGVNLRNIAISEYLPPQVAMYGVGRPKGLALLSDDGTAVVDADGNPIEATADWEGLTGKPSVIAAGADAGAARSAIGAASAEAVASKADLDSGTGKLAASQLPTVPVERIDASSAVESLLTAADADGARTAIGALSSAAPEIAAARGAASGIAPLDSGSRVPDVNLPARLSADSLAAAYAPVSQALWIPADQFDAGEGTPAFGTINANQSWGWMLDDASSEGCTTLLTVPAHWSQITEIEVWWAPLTAAGGNVVWAGAVYNLAHGGSLQASGSALTNLGTSPAGSTAYQVRVQASGPITLGVDPTKVQRLFVRRSGGNGSDTYVGDCAFLGVKVIGS